MLHSYLTIIQAAYEECHRAVLSEMFKELFYHHEPGDDTTIADTQKKIYGKLLSLKKTPLPSSIDRTSLTLQVAIHTRY